MVLSPIVLPVSLVVRPFWAASVIVIASGCVYQIPQIAVWGMTLGARAAGVQVTTTQGQPPGWARATARWATPGVISSGYRVVAPGRLTLLAGVVVIVVIYSPAFFDTRRRAVIDRVAGTVVVDRAHVPVLSG